MLFIDNKYTKTYYNIVDSARSRTISGYTETHHIIPKSLGGTDANTNLVKLSAREHFICHWLLIKMCQQQSHRNKMIYALYCMRQGSTKHQRYNADITSRVYAKLKGQIVVSLSTREKISQANKGKTKSKKYILYMSNNMKGDNNHFYGKHHSIAVKEKISNSMKGRTPWNKGKRLTKEHIDKIVSASTGRKHTAHSEETKAKMRAAKKDYVPWNKGLPAQKYACVYCGKECNLLNLKRWHGDNCKLNKLS
jgi:hypothetical protein